MNFRKKDDNTYQGTTWQIKFNLDTTINKEETYTLRLALASAAQAELQVKYINVNFIHYNVVTVKYIDLNGSNLVNNFRFGSTIQVQIAFLDFQAGLLEGTMRLQGMGYMGCIGYTMWKYRAPNFPKGAIPSI